MKTIAIHIKQKNKGDRRLTLQNLRDEIVGFMYRDTVARSTRSDMQFYVLIFLASVPNKEETALDTILKEGLPRFERLNSAFASHKGYLKRSQYHEMVIEYNLEDVFFKDVFFVICEAVLNLEEIKYKFSDYLKNRKGLVDVLERIETSYGPRVRADFQAFSSASIEDFRTDDNGETHDLSKSVYRTPRMRTLRNLDLNLQKYTTIKKIESNSPVDLTFLQDIDPSIVIDLWDKYHLAEYASKFIKDGYRIANDNLPSGLISNLVTAYITYKLTNGNDDRKLKRQAKIDFEVQQAEHRQELEQLNSLLVRSVLESQKMLQQEVKRLKKELRQQMDKNKQLRDEDLLKTLQERVEKLENLDVATKEEERNDEPQISLL